jgi:hypothetical protein
MSISKLMLFKLFIGSPEVSFTLMKMELGSIAITTTGKSYLIAIYGRNVALGLLRSRLLALKQYFSRIFEHLNES